LTDLSGVADLAHPEIRPAHDAGVTTVDDFSVDHIAARAARIEAAVTGMSDPGRGLGAAQVHWG
jgi:hypothetical protein